MLPDVLLVVATSVPVPAVVAIVVNIIAIVDVVAAIVVHVDIVAVAVDVCTVDHLLNDIPCVSLGVRETPPMSCPLCGILFASKLPPSTNRTDHQDASGRTPRDSGRVSSAGQRSDRCGTPDDRSCLPGRTSKRFMVDICICPASYLQPGFGLDF